MTKKTNEVWLEQMVVFPHVVGVFEHDEPYAVEFETTTGVTRTRLLEDDEAKKIRKFNKLEEPAEVANDSE